MQHCPDTRGIKEPINQTKIRRPLGPCNTCPGVHPLIAMFDNSSSPPNCCISKVGMFDNS